MSLKGGRITLGAGLLAAALAVAASPVLARQGSELDDARIAHVAVTANAIDVEMGELAKERARDARVRQFAERMVTDHTGVNEQAAALAQRLGVTPAANSISRSLREDAAAARRKLEGTATEGFDRAYIEHEVAYHRAVLNALDETLIPATRNAELKQLLEQARGAVAAHLGHAEELRQALAQS